MGLVTGRNMGKDIFDKRWITAKIKDASNHIYFVPIRYVLGDYFIAEIEKQTYCFKIDASKIEIFRESMVKSFRVLNYSTKHYLPIDSDHTKQLEDLLRQNNLPKVDGMLSSVLKYVGKREARNPKDFKPASIEDMFNEAVKLQNDLPEETQNLKTFLMNLGIKEIVTPVREVSEFIEDDLKTTDPQFLGTIIQAWQRVDVESRIMNNKPITGKKSWLKLIAIFVVIGLVVAIGVIGYTTGMFNHLIPQIGSAGITSNPVQAQSDLLKTYPTPESLVNAIGIKAVTCTSLPPEIVKMVNSAKAGTCP